MGGGGSAYIYLQGECRALGCSKSLPPYFKILDYKQVFGCQPESDQKDWGRGGVSQKVTKSDGRGESAKTGQNKGTI